MYYIGIDVGGTNLKAGLVDEAGTILRVSRRPLAFQDAEHFSATLAELAEEVMGSLSLREVHSIGIGIPGAVRGGTVLFTANIPMRNVPLEALVRQHLDLPVYLANDADCAAAAEYLYGSGRGSRDFITVTLGTGVGGGLILNGHLHTGMCCAGEVGLMVIDLDGADCSCGSPGCWENYASATGLIRLARLALQKNPQGLLLGKELDGKTIFSAAEQGDPLALQVVKTYDRYLAVGLTNLVDILQPEIIAIGGGVAQAPAHLLLEPVARYVHENCYGRHVNNYPRVVTATMGNDAGIVGAALIGTLLS